METSTLLWLTLDNSLVKFYTPVNRVYNDKFCYHAAIYIS